MVRSPIAARQIIYGQAKVLGVLVYISTTGTKNEFLHMVIAIAGHEVEALSRDRQPMAFRSQRPVAPDGPAGRSLAL